MWKGWCKKLGLNVLCLRWNIVLRNPGYKFRPEDLLRHENWRWIFNDKIQSSLTSIELCMHALWSGSLFLQTFKKSAGNRKTIRTTDLHRSVKATYGAAFRISQPWKWPNTSLNPTARSCSWFGNELKSQHLQLREIEKLVITPRQLFLTTGLEKNLYGCCQVSDFLQILRHNRSAKWF